MPAIHRRSLRTIAAVLSAVDELHLGEIDDRQLREARAAVAFAMKSGAQARKMSRERRELKVKVHRDARSEIRALVVARAAGCCEACGLELAFGEGDCDELFGGFGRRRQKMAIENVWVLHRSCHREKTINHPTAVYWDLKALLWARRNGYKETERLLENRIPIGDLP